MGREIKLKKEFSSKKKYILFFVLSLFCLFSSTDVASVTIRGSMLGYAWSDNIGWVSFSCVNDDSCATSDYGVDVVSGNVLTGYAWSDNLGWISFNSSDLIGCPSGACNASLTDGKIIGWAKQINNSEAGWIKLGPINIEGTDYGVTVTGQDVAGYAWSDAFGWLSFSCANNDNCATSDYGVIYEAAPSVVENLNVDIRYCEHDNFNTVNDGLVVVFSWDFIGELSQRDYEIELATDSGFTSPFVMTATTASSSYVLNLEGSAWNGEQLDWGDTYYWRVRATDEGGTTSSWEEESFTISHTHGSPWVKIEHVPEEILAGGEVTFNGTSSIVYDGSTPTYSWIFEGGSPATSTESEEVVTFDEVGDDFTTTLTVTDGTGYSCQKTELNKVNLFNPIWKNVSPF